MAFFVLGMHRSGTSMVASILQSLGVSLGPEEDMVPANQFNAAGYYENAPSVAANDAFLKKNDISWRTLPVIETRTTLKGVDEYAATIGEIVKGLDANGLWCVKDPRLSFLLPYWTAAAGPASAIVCLRRPDAAALSLKTRNDLSVSYSAALWELYTLAALRNTRAMPRAVVVYEQLLANPQQAIEKLIASLPDLAKLKPGPGAIKAAVARVRGDLDHSQPVNSKAMPPAVLELYERLAKGDLDTTGEDAEHGVASELVRLEAGHQAAKRLNSEARDQLARVSEQLAAQKTAFARHMERVSDIVGLIAPPGGPPPTDPDALLDSLRQLARTIPGPDQKSMSDAAARELASAKDDRIAWLRNELDATGARTQTVLDQASSLEVEVARLRAEHEQHGRVTAANHRDVMRLAAEVQRLNERLAKAEDGRAELQAERTRVKSEYETTLARLAAERGIVTDTMNSLRARLEEKEALLARIQTERLEDQATTAALKRIAEEREGLMANLSRATQALEQRNRELAELGGRERELNQRALRLDGDIERLQRDIQHSRIREVELISILAARDQAESVLRAAVSQHGATASEMQVQMLAARETIESLEATLAERTRRAEELEAQHVDNRRQLAEYDVRIPILEAAAVERAQLSSRNSELKAEIARIIADREKTLEKNRTSAAALEKQVTELKAEIARIIADRDSTLEKDRTAAAALEEKIAEREARIRSQESEMTRLRAAASKYDALLASYEESKASGERLKKMYEQREEVARKALRDQDAIIENLKQAALEGEQAAARAAEAEARLLRFETNIDVMASEQLDEARREAADLREQLALARSKAGAMGDGEVHPKGEYEELERALQSARDRAEQLKAELTSKETPASSSKAPTPSDQRLRRQLLVLNELLQAIDALLSPKYGRFTIPVRQIRVRLTQARQVVDGEVAMTRR